MLHSAAHAGPRPAGKSRQPRRIRGFYSPRDPLYILIEPNLGYQPINFRVDVKPKTSPAKAAEAAELLALQALAWLASEPDMLDRFMAATGLDAPRLQRGAANPEFLAGALDFLLADEDGLTRFCGAAELDPAEPARARRLLPGWSE